MHECVWQLSIFREQEGKTACLSRSKPSMFVKTSTADWFVNCADADIDPREISSTLIPKITGQFW